MAQNYPKMRTKSEEALYHVLKDVSKKIKGEKYVNFINPLRNVGEAWELKNEKISFLKLPRIDKASMSTNAEVVMSKRMLDRTYQRWEKKRCDINKNRTYLTHQWWALTQKEKLLGQEFKKFEQFLRSNMEKRERAMRKYSDDRNAYYRRTAEVISMKYRTESQKAALANMQEEIRKNAKYQRYLEDVAEKSGGQFKDASDLVTRLEMLLNAKEHIRQRQKEEERRLEDSVALSIIQVRSKMSKILQLRGELPNSRIRYDESKRRGAEWETLVINLKAKLSSLLSDLQTNRNTIDKIYNNIRARMQLSDDSRNNDNFYKVVVIAWILDKFTKIQKTLEEVPKKKISFSIAK